MEPVIPNFELTGVMKCHTLKSYLSHPRHSSVSRAEGVSPLGGSGHHKYICNYTRNVWKKQESNQGPYQAYTKKSSLSLTFLILFLCCKDPKHFLVQNENAQSPSVKWCLISRLAAFQPLDQSSKIKIAQLAEDLLLFLDECAPLLLIYRSCGFMTSTRAPKKASLGQEFLEFRG